MNERAELRLFSGDECKIIAYEWDGIRLVMVETTYDKTWVSSQLSDDPPDSGWWADEHDYDNTWDEPAEKVCVTCACPIVLGEAWYDHPRYGGLEYECEGCHKTREFNEEHDLGEEEI